MELYRNLDSLRLSGQYDARSHSVMSVINKNLPLLRELSIRGSIRYHDGDGEIFSWETVNWEYVSTDMLDTLFDGESSIEILDISLPAIDNKGLRVIGESANSSKFGTRQPN